jgi:hypothetical protein
MNVSPILSPSGEPVFTAGGKHAWKTAEHRGYRVSLEWAKSGRNTRCVLVIWSAPIQHIHTFGREPANGLWVIAKNAIHQFVGFDKDDHCTGGASEHCLRECLEAMPILGKDRNDKQAFVALVDTVIRFAPELVHMPVAPLHVKRELADEAMWEVTATNKNTGKTISEASV